MGDINQKIYLTRTLAKVQGPIIEIGSKDYGNTTTFRDAYPGNEYVGIDMEAGPGVDKILDLAEGTGDLPLAYFELAVCCSVLEHVRQPWKMAEHLGSLVRPGGKLFISAPWVWRYHPYPDDFFRFSPRGIASLFPDFRWGNHCYSTNLPNELFPFDDQSVLGVDDRMAFFKPVATGQRKYLPYLNVNMLGVKTDPQAAT